MLTMHTTVADMSDWVVRVGLVAVGGSLGCVGCAAWGVTTATRPLGPTQQMHAENPERRIRNL